MANNASFRFERVFAGTLLGASEPVMAAITAVVFTGAVFSWADFAGFALIFIMMILLR